MAPFLVEKFPLWKLSAMFRLQLREGSGSLGVWLRERLRGEAPGVALLLSSELAETRQEGSK